MGTKPGAVMAGISNHREARASMSPVPEVAENGRNDRSIFRGLLADGIYQMIGEHFPSFAIIKVAMIYRYFPPAPLVPRLLRRPAYVVIVHQQRQVRSEQNRQWPKGDADPTPW